MKMAPETISERLLELNTDFNMNKHIVLRLYITTTINEISMTAIKIIRSDA